MCSNSVATPPARITRKFSACSLDFTFAERTRDRGYFQMSVIERLWREHRDGRHVWDEHLWLLLNFELWQRIYLDREPV